MHRSRFTQGIALIVLTLITATAVAEKPPVPQDPPNLLTENQAFQLYQTVESSAPSTKAGLNATERARVLRDAINHPIARITLIDPANPANVYDHPRGIVGFCFGRAMTTHLLARKLGLRDDGIHKLFIIGALDQRAEPVEDPQWRFHVTTLIRGTDQQWYAVDPIMHPSLDPRKECTNGRAWTAGTPIKAEEWACIVKRTWDKRDEAFLYRTAAGTVVPDITKDAAGTTGEHVIELAFDPTKTEGFEEASLGRYTVYAPDRQRQIDYFIGTLTSDAAKRFKLNSITVPSLGEVSYRNFFVHLLRSFQGRQPERRLGGAPTLQPESAAASAPTIAPGNLGSPRFFRR